MEESAKIIKMATSQSVPLKTGGGDGTFTGMGEVDAKIAAAEARTDTKFAEVLGELKLMRQQASHLPSTWTLVGTVAAFSFAMGTGILSILAFAGDRFDGGVAIGIASIDRKLGIEQVLKENAEQTQKIEDLSLRMDQMLRVLQTSPGKQSGDFMPVPSQQTNPK